VLGFVRVVSSVSGVDPTEPTVNTSPPVVAIVFAHVVAKVVVGIVSAMADIDVVWPPRLVTPAVCVLSFDVFDVISIGAGDVVELNCSVVDTDDFPGASLDVTSVGPLVTTLVLAVAT
jgi:hypothetical protein